MPVDSEVLTPSILRICRFNLSEMLMQVELCARTWTIDCIVPAKKNISYFFGGRQHDYWQ